VRRRPIPTVGLLIWSASLGWSPACAQTEADDPLEILESEIDAAADALRTRATRESRSAELSGEAIGAFREGDYARAESILLEQKAIDPNNFVVHYNLACAHAALGEPDRANADLRRAVELGFSNRGHLEQDPYLRPLHGTDDFRLLLERWPTVLGLQRATRLKQTREWVRGRTVERADESLRIDVISAHDAPETDAAMREIRKVAAWAHALMPVDGDEAEESSSSFVVIALPEKRDFLRWAFWTYGERARRAFAGIGGSYEHDEKRLVAQDLGGTLRHEFFHILHWRDMDRLGQVHPIWIQEGLASLVEDLDPARIAMRVRTGSRVAPEGIDPNLIAEPLIERGQAVAGPGPDAEGWMPAPSWRSNIVKRLARTGPLPSFESFTAMDHETFSTSRPLATYAHARTILLWLESEGKLGAWYRAYTTDSRVGYDADRSGLLAMESVLEMELPDIENSYREWVRGDLPMVAETGNDLDGVLGVDIEQKEMVGPMVSRVTRSARQRTGLRRLDIITAIDGRPVHDMKELIRVLSAYEPGETVTVDYRRVRLRESSEVPLIPRP